MSDSFCSELWDRIAAFPFDEGRPQLTFAQRLARDHGWSAQYTRRVIDEYRRFAYLFVAGGHPVSPSDDVDHA